MEKTAKEIIAAGNVPAAVDFAIELNRRIAAQGRELDEVKRYLRDVAREDVGDSGRRSTEIIGNLGVASVVFDRDAVKTRRDMSLTDIEENLEAETFARLFVTRVLVEPTPDFLEKIESVTPTERAVLDNFLVIEPSTPKVYLPK